MRSRMLAPSSGYPRHRQFEAPGAFVKQVYGESAESREPGNELRNLGEQLLEVEDRVTRGPNRTTSTELGVCRDTSAALRVGIRRRIWQGFGHRVAGWADSRRASGIILGSHGSPEPATGLHRHRAHPSASLSLLLVDRVTELEPDKRIVGIKNVSLNERYLSHQPGERPALPPTILTECIAQVGAILILSKPENRGRIPLFRGIERVRFRRPVYAGDVVEIEARVKSPRSRVGQLDGFARVNGRVVVDGTMTFALGPTARATPEETLR